MIAIATIRIDQRSGIGRFNKIATVDFAPGENDRIVLSGAGLSNGYVSADGLAVEPVGARPNTVTRTSS